MTPFVLDASLLRAEAARLARDLSVLTAERTAATDALGEDFLLLDSPVFTAGRRRFGDILEDLGAPLMALGRMEAALMLTAIAQEELERAYRLVAGVGGMCPAHELADRSGLISAILRDLVGLGRALDLACAKEIEAAARLCTPLAPPPRHSLGDFAGVGLDEVSSVNLLGAPPEVLALAERYPDARFLEVGDGTVAAAFGDLDSADCVVTMVAGVGSSDPAGWEGNLGRAERLHSSTGAATIMWLGYEAPDSVPAALSTAPARAGGERLREFQSGLRGRNPGAALVVAGHSYGSTVAGHAATGEGLDADALVLMGSPGVPGELTLRGEDPRVVAVLGDRDPIGLAGTGELAVHGRDPAAATSGFERWRVPGDHSGYVDDPVFVDKLRGLLTETATAKGA